MFGLVGLVYVTQGRALSRYIDVKYKKSTQARERERVYVCVWVENI